MTAPWPCDECGQPGIRNVYARGYCPAHLANLYRTFNPTSWGLNGIGLPTGRRNDGLHDLQCVACQAGWVGAMFERCPWCQQALADILKAAS